MHNQQIHLRLQEHIHPTEMNNITALRANKRNSFKYVLFIMLIDDVIHNTRVTKKNCSNINNNSQETKMIIYNSADNGRMFT